MLVSSLEKRTYSTVGVRCVFKTPKYATVGSEEMIGSASCVRLDEA
jgi:hypothetical protein